LQFSNAQTRFKFSHEMLRSSHTSRTFPNSSSHHSPEMYSPSVISPAMHNRLAPRGLLPSSLGHVSAQMGLDENAQRPDFSSSTQSPGSSSHIRTWQSGQVHIPDSLTWYKSLALINYLIFNSQSTFGLALQPTHDY
jgi:hypothetical protein